MINKQYIKSCLVNKKENSMESQPQQQQQHKYNYEMDHYQHSSPPLPYQTYSQDLKRYRPIIPDRTDRTTYYDNDSIHSDNLRVPSEPFLYSKSLLSQPADTHYGQPQPIPPQLQDLNVVIHSKNNIGMYLSIGLALFTSILCIIVLLILRPPFIMYPKTKENQYSQPFQTIQLEKVLGFGIGTFALCTFVIVLRHYEFFTTTLPNVWT
jgi:hypothetical protein